MAVPTRIQAILDLLVLAEAACLVLVLLCLGFHPRRAAMEEALFTIWGLTTEAEVAVQQHLRVHTARRARGAEEVLLHLQVAATGLLVRPRHRPNLV